MWYAEEYNDPQKHLVLRASKDVPDEFLDRGSHGTAPPPPDNYDRWHSPNPPLLRI